MDEHHNKVPKILSFVRRVMPNATEEELIAADNRFREYVRFCIDLQERIERDREAEMREQEAKENES